MTTKALTVPAVRSLLDQIKPQIAMALPKHVTPDRMIRVALTQVQKNPKLLECTQISLLGAIVQSAQLGLEPDSVTGFAYLVPYWNGKKKQSECQLIPGYKGLMNLARRSGDIGAIEARAVYQRDEFDFSFGLKPILKHKPFLGEQEGDPLYFYAIAHFKDGSIPQFEVMTLGQINKIRGRSKAQEYGPWVTDFEAMAKKTVIRRLLKFAPTSVEVQKAIALDERAALNLPQDLGDALNQPEDADQTPKEVKAGELFGKEETAAEGAK